MRGGLGKVSRGVTKKSSEKRAWEGGGGTQGRKDPPGYWVERYRATRATIAAKVVKSTRTE